MPLVIRQKDSDSDSLKSAIAELNSALEEMNAAYNRVKEAQANLDKIKNKIDQDVDTPPTPRPTPSPDTDLGNRPIPRDESIDRLVDLARIR